MDATYLRNWFVVEFVNLSIEDEKEFRSFLEKWMPKYSPLYTNPDDWHVPMMLLEINKDSSEFVDLDVVVERRKHFLKFQLELKEILIDFNNTAAANFTNNEGFRIINLISEHHIHRLGEKLEKIHFTLKHQAVSGSIMQVITPDISDFETSLYYNFIQYANAHPSVLVCAGCKKYISKPNHHQFANARRGYATIHDNKFCQQDYKREKDRNRKRGGKTNE